MWVQMGESEIALVERGQVRIGVQVRLEVGDRLAVLGHRDRELVAHPCHQLIAGQGQGVDREEAEEGRVEW